MRATRALLTIAALIVSIVPLLWMVVLTITQLGNLGLNPPYWREIVYIVPFWIGFVSAVVFARRCFVSAPNFVWSPLLISLILVGLAGGIGEELILFNNAKFSFPIGFFELAIASWVIAGLIARKLPRSRITSKV